MTEEKVKTGVFVKVKDVVGTKLKRFCTLLDAKSSSPALKAELAKLRRGLGKAPGEIPELWESIFGEMPEELFGTGENPSHLEWAVYSALTLYAFHQQGNDTPMHVDGVDIGRAVARLTMSNEDAAAAVRRRFNIFATSDGIEELLWHARGLVGLLKSSGIPIDYSRLAEDFFKYQRVEYQNSVRLNWGRSFYSEQSKATKENNKNAIIEEE